jgi:cupin fold WbuC family metalloprotein
METVPVKRLTQELFNTLAEQAQQNARLRQNHNFHELPEKVQRFLNVLQPGTYVRPHHHHRQAGVNGFEFFIVLQGAIGIVIFDDQKNVIQTEQLTAGGPLCGLELAEGTFHTIVALAPNTVMFELKEGPYVPSTDKDFLDGFPLKASAEAKAWVQKWETYFA